jgi:glycosyltransferase involved in cell wall biosynthesis
MVYFLIPAYEEEETIGLLLYKLRSVMESVRRDYLAIVLDDGSRDATARTAEQYRKFLPVRVLKHAKNNGFGPALDRLVRESCRLSRYPQRDIAITIEGDFSWSPDPVPAMVREIEAGADIVIKESLITRPRSAPTGSARSSKRSRSIRRTSSRAVTTLPMSSFCCAWGDCTHRSPKWGRQAAATSAPENRATVGRVRSRASSV